MKNDKTILEKEPLEQASKIINIKKVNLIEKKKEY